MKEFRTKSGTIFFATNDVNEIAVSDYYAGAILYAQEKLFNKEFYVVNRSGYPIEDDKLLREIKRMNLEF